MTPKKTARQITKTVSARFARAQLGGILDRAARRQERFIVTKNGQAKAIILGVGDFLHAVVKTPASLAALQGEAEKSGMAGLSWEDIEAEIELVRRGKIHQKV